MNTQTQKNIIKVYSGKLHKCMCGCSGKYSYTKDNPRSVKIISNKIFNNPDVKFEYDYAYVELDNRILVAYFEK